MQPRPLYRWKSFWLGVLVLGFLGWAWCISYHSRTGAYFKGYALTQGEGYTLTVLVPGSGLPSESNFRHVEVLGRLYSPQILPPPFIVRGQGLPAMKSPFVDQVNYRTNMEWMYRSLPKDRVAVCLPHWLIVLAFLIPWTAFLAWRWRRMRSNTEPH